VSALDAEMELLAKQILNYRQTISGTRRALNAAGLSIREATDKLSLADGKVS
jgi:hypothetical protein